MFQKEKSGRGLCQFQKNAMSLRLIVDKLYVAGCFSSHSIIKSLTKKRLRRHLRGSLWS